MNKLINYIKKNKLYLAILLVGLVLLGIQLDQVIMYADDYTLGIYSNTKGLQGAWEYFVFNYFHWGGGFTGLIVISILTIGFKSWLFIEMFLILAIILITIRFIHLKDGKYKELTAIFVWLLYFLIDRSTSRETVLWLDGSIAYVFTTLQVLLYAYLLYTRIHYPKMRKKYDYVLFPLAAFFGGWSAAQSGAMVVLITIICWLFAKFINKEKISKFYFWTSLLTIVGYCIFFFAPGNSARMSVIELYSSLGFFERILYKVDSLFGICFDFRSYPYFGLPIYTYSIVVLLILVANHLLKKEENEKLKFVLTLGNIYNMVFLTSAILASTSLADNFAFVNAMFKYVNLYTALSTNSFSVKYLIPYAFTSVTVLIMCIQTLYISIKKKDSLLLIIMVCAVASQGVMLMAPTHPYRTTFISIVFFIIGIAYLFKYVLENKVKWEYYIPIIFLIKYVPIGCILLVTFYLVNNNLKDCKIVKTSTINLLVLGALISLFSAYNWMRITYNYNINKEINDVNMERIEDYQKHPTKERILVLIAPKDEEYGFTPLAGSDWVEADIVTYFHLEKHTDIMFEEEYAEYLDDTQSNLVQENKEAIQN